MIWKFSNSTTGPSIYNLICNINSTLCCLTHVLDWYKYISPYIVAKKIENECSIYIYITIYSVYRYTYYNRLQYANYYYKIANTLPF